MKSLRDIRTKLNGKYLPITVAVCGVLIAISTAVLFHNYNDHQRAKEESQFVLSKEQWHCFAGVLIEDSGFECLVYKRKGLDLGPNAGSRHREYDKKQRTSVHTQ